MKTYVTLACCCAALLAGGCTGQRECGPEGPGGPKELRFGVSTLDKTRGYPTLGVDEIASMGVFGYTTAEPIPNTGSWAYPANLLDNQKVIRDVAADPDTWEYDPQAFWPSDLSLNNTFFAYSPHVSEFAESSYAVARVPEGGGAPTLRYTLPETIAEQRDILWARPVYNVNMESTTGVDEGMVGYHMEHAMTWIAFVLAPSSALAEGEDRADFRETYSVNWMTFMADNLPHTSTLDLETGEWDTAGTRANVQWDFLLDPEKSQNIEPGQTARLTDESNRMMIFPFDIEKDMATIDLAFYYNKDGDSYDAATDTYTGTEYYYYLPIPETPMEPGSVVVYLINVSIEGPSVEFLGTNRIEDWIEGGSKGGSDEDLIGMF